MGSTIRTAIAILALAQPNTIDVPFPPPLPGTTLVDTTRVGEPLELKQATADAEAVIAGQSYIQYIYEPRQVTAGSFLVWYRDALFTAGWKLIDVRIHSLHFEHDRPIIQELESEPTLRQLADLIRSKNTAAVRIEGHMDNIGEEGGAERETLSLGRARMVVVWLTKHGDVPATKVTAHGLGKNRPIADNDTDLGRALNRRIEVARSDCTR